MKPQFCKWIGFGSRKILIGVKSPGVYLLAHFKHKPSDNADVTSSDIIYIGESRTNILTRLNNFENSALKYNYANHSGGLSYKKKHLSCVITSIMTNYLYVAILPVYIEEEEEERAAYIKYIERLAILEYVKKNDQYPTCNKRLY